MEIKNINGDVIFQVEGSSLISANLHGADLWWANLRDADLHGADLWCANLQGADLRGANLQGANLQGADLRGADLRGANLHGADLWWANLRDADLHGADLWCANLQGADLRGANLQGADLRDADLDFSSGISFHCASFDFKADLRLAAQLAYHFCRIDFGNCEEAKKAQKALNDLANKFHRVDECGKIE